MSKENTGSTARGGGEYHCSDRADSEDSDVAVNHCRLRESVLLKVLLLL